MSNLRSWAVYVAAVATGLTPGLLVLSTSFIGRFLLCVAEMLEPKPGRPRPSKSPITISAWQRRTKMSQIFWSLTAIASLLAIIFIVTRPQSD